jgi:transcription elongation factor SPT5
LSDKWLLDTKFVNKSGLLCEIRGSFARGTEKGWLNGDHEAQKVIVLSVFDSGNERFSSRARIKFYETPSQGPIPEIPVQLLRPVHPNKAGQDIIILAGNYKGQGGKVRSVEAHGTVAVMLDPSTLFIEEKIEHAVRVEHVGDT